MNNKLLIHRPFKYSYTRVTLKLIILNFLIFAIQLLNSDLSKMFYVYGCMNPINVIQNHAYWQFLTYMFLHSDISHIVFNMLGLLCFGMNLERAIGSKEFLLFYLFCGILSGVLSFAVYTLTGNYRVILLGASGAIYAVLFAYAVVFPRSVILIWGIIPVPAPILVLIYTIVEIGSQFTGRNASVAHMTHLFGFFAAWLYFVVRMGVHPIKVWKKR